ncbi:MAG: ATP-binding protein [Thermoguttaceae bacterium]
MTVSLAVAGKGGTGKTTLCALVVRALCERQIRPVLAVDADPNSNLAEALGVQPGTPLAEIRERGSSPEGSPASGIGRVRSVQDEIHRAVTEAEGFDLITMGRPEGPRCYCYVNSLLRQALDALAAGYAAVVIDNEAGMEHLSRRTTNNVDLLAVVMDPTLPALRAARRILALSQELPIRIGRRAVLVNRVGPAGTPPEIDRQLAELGVWRLADVPEDEEVQRSGALGGDVFALSEDNPALAAVRRVLEAAQAAFSSAVGH